MNQPRDSKGRFIKMCPRIKQPQQPRDSNGRFASNKAPSVVHGFKGFDKNFQCRGMQYKVGETYTVDGELVCCENGLHFCTNPMDVFWYYDPVHPNRYAEVTALGKTAGMLNSDDSKLCTNKLSIDSDLSLVEYCNKAIHNRLSDMPVMSIRKASSICGGRFALQCGFDSICIDDNLYGVAYAVDALIAITRKRNSVSFTSDRSGLAVTFGSQSIAKGAYAIGRGRYSVGISDKEFGLAVAPGGRAITCCDYSTAVCGSSAALTLEGAYNVGVMYGMYADVRGKNCILIVRNIANIMALKLRKGTLVVLAEFSRTPISKSVVFVAGVDLKPAHKDNIYTRAQIMTYYINHKVELKCK